MIAHVFNIKNKKRKSDYILWLIDSNMDDVRNF